MQPCLPGISTRAGCFIVAVFQIVTASVEIVIYTLALISLEQYGDLHLDLSLVKKFQGTFALPIMPGANTEGGNIGPLFILMFSVALVGALVYFFLGVILFAGTKRNDTKLLKIWTMCQMFLIVSAVVYMIATLIMGCSSATNVIVDLSTLIFQFYFLWLVYYFLETVRDEQTLTLAPSMSSRKNGERIDLSFPLDAFEHNNCQANEYKKC